MARKINVGIIGLGNCAKSFIEGVAYYTNNPHSTGLTNEVIGGYKVSDIKIALAIDVDERKIRKPINEAIYAFPNCAITPRMDKKSVFNVIEGPFFDVLKGKVLDGVADHMKTEDPTDKERFCLSSRSPEMSYHMLVNILEQSEIDVALLYLPVGSEEATKFYVQALLEVGIPFVNCIPVFIVSDPVWQQKIKDAGIVAIGDDMRSQFGASILSQVLQEAMLSRGIDVKFHSQINQGGNTDFYNMTDKNRLQSKKISKENVITSQNDIYEHKMESGSVYAGPSDYIPYLKDNKVAILRVEGEGFLGQQITLDCRLSVQDSPNSGGIVIDAVRYLMTAQDMGITGPLYGPSAITQKTPPKQLKFSEAMAECEKYINFRKDPII